MARVEVCWRSTPDERCRIGSAVHAALVEALRVPADDPTVIVIERDPDGVVAPSKVSSRYTIVSVTMFSGRTLTAKRRLYASLVRRLTACGVPTSDVLTVLEELPMENWGVDGGIPASETNVGFEVDV